jgi:hypothetical protein
MNYWRRLFTGFLNDTYGASASAMFLVCLLSGILLVPFFDITAPYKSIASLLLYQPWATFFRDLHFWSAQFFFVLTLVHLWGYLRPKYFKTLRIGIWIRLALAIPLLFFVMFSGFLLKGDADSSHAQEIFRELLLVIPWLGSYLSDLSLGRQGNLSIPYVHHVATSTIILLIIIREHARKLWSGYPVFVSAFILSSLFALFLRAPLHDGISQLVKGPWYFLGVQELLHWLPYPSAAWYLLLLFLSLFIALPFARPLCSRLIRYVLLGMGGIFVIATLFGVFFRAEGWGLTFPGSGRNADRYPVLKNPFIRAGDIFMDPTLRSGISESCVHCHDAFTGFSAGHEPAKIGCYACHGGDKFSTNAASAHKGMRIVPGNLFDVEKSCATSACHPDIFPRIERSLMTSNSGIVSVNRWVFGESSHPSLPAHINDIGHSAADTHVRNLCAACHLGREKTVTGPVDENSRGGGCLACHLNYSAAALNQWKGFRNGRGAYRELRAYVHPSISIETGNQHCFGCHSRSGRISTNYEGWHETLLPLELAGPANRVVQGSRVFSPMPADVHHKAGMSCIDCHSARDVMGDGREHRHKEEAVSISCSDCHKQGNTTNSGWKNIDYESRKILKIRNIDTSWFFITESASGNIVPGARASKPGAEPLFYPRDKGRVMSLKPPATACFQGASHERLHCSACHTGWASRCIGCHTGFDKERNGRDLLENRAVKGAWYELMADFLVGPPGLGVVEGSDGKSVIRPVIPGMIMTIDLSSFNSRKSIADTLFRRLFAVAEPHTTQATGRSCLSCHNDPVALGYGGGKLSFVKIAGKGQWLFEPEYANLQDGLPADAWIGFLQSRSGMLATRQGIRPFSVDEQKRILEVGACLTCHDGSSKVMRDALVDYKSTRQRLSRHCVVPDYPKK